MRVATAILLTAAPALVLGAPCEDALSDLFTTYQDVLFELISQPAKAGDVCSGETWPAMQEKIKESAVICIEDSAKDAAGFAPLMEMLNDLPCLQIDGNYCWENFGYIVAGPAMQLYAAHQQKTSFSDIMLDFSVTPSQLEGTNTPKGICGTDEGKCFRQTTNKIIRRIGQLPTTSQQAKDAVASFQQYAADISSACEKDDVPKEQCADRECWCKVRFDKVFKSSKKFTEALPAPDQFCNEDGTLQFCIEKVVSRQEAFVTLPFTGEELAKKCCEMAGCNKDKFHIVTATLNIRNIRAAYAESSKELVYRALKYAVAYEFGRLPYRFTIDSVDEIEGGVLVSLTLKLQDGADEKLDEDRIKAMIGLLLSHIENGHFVLPSIEVLPLEAKYNPEEPVTIAIAGSKIEMKAPPSDPAAGGSGSDDLPKDLSGATAISASITSAFLAGLLLLAQW